MTAGSDPARRVLIVEDEMLIALMLQDMLQDSGHFVEGVATSLQIGLDLAIKANAELAILDINLNGEECYPIVEILQQRGIPFVFSTGYGSGTVRPEFDAVPKLVKPYEQDLLVTAIRAAFAGRL